MTSTMCFNTRADSILLNRLISQTWWATSLTRSHLRGSLPASQDAPIAARSAMYSARFSPGQRGGSSRKKRISPGTRCRADILLDMALVNAFYAFTNQLRVFFPTFWRTAMEMMDLKAAIRLFDHYASMLDAQQRLLQRTRSLAKSDPELAEYVTSQTESLRDSSRNYAAFSILFSKKVVKQS